MYDLRNINAYEKYQLYGMYYLHIFFTMYDDKYATQSNQIDVFLYMYIE